MSLMNPKANFTRPANTTQYASGDLVANHATAGSVTPMQFNVGKPGGGAISITKARITKSGTGITAAAMYLHLFAASPAVSNGDNGAFVPSQAAAYLGTLTMAAMIAGSDGAFGEAIPLVGTAIEATLPGAAIYGLLEARGTYTPASEEVFNVHLVAREA